MDGVHGGGAAPCDEGRDGGGDPEQQEVAPGFFTIAEEAHGEDGHKPRSERNVPFAADEETEDEDKSEGEIFFFFLRILCNW